MSPVGLHRANVARDLKDFGQAVWPVYEGWYTNPDGSYTFLVGYLNPNREQTFDLPVSKGNFFSPGEPDRGQPTHFATGRGWAVFGVRVGRHYANKSQQLTWTLVTNDQTTSIPMHTDPNSYVVPFEDAPTRTGHRRFGSRRVGRRSRDRPTESRHPTAPRCPSR